MVFTLRILSGEQNAGLAATEAMASANIRGRSGGTSLPIPVKPIGTLAPGRSEATTGQPLSMAST